MVTKKETPGVDPWEDKSETPMRPSEFVSDRDRLTITLKAGTGYDAPWLVYHASSVEEGVDFLSHERFDELADLTARKGKELAKAFGGSQGFSKPAAATFSGYSKPAASQPSSDVPSGICPTHNCDLVYVEPFKKRDGSEISARVACPVPKCYAKTFWHNKDGSWTEK